MAAVKIIILFAIICVAMSFPQIPTSRIIYGQQDSSSASELHSRKVRSPDNEPKRTVEARGEHNGRHGQSASVTYTHPVGKNVDVYGSVSRQFKYNDNSGHVGVRYKF